MSDHAAGREAVARTRRIVVKVGSSVLTHDGKLRDDAFEQIARQIAELCDDGREVVLVSSGSIAIGSRELGWQIPKESIPEKQAAAAIGQIGLIERYRAQFAQRGRKVGQPLDFTVDFFLADDVGIPEVDGFFQWFGGQVDENV